MNIFCKYFGFFTVSNTKKSEEFFASSFVLFSFLHLFFRYQDILEWCNCVQYIFKQQKRQIFSRIAKTLQKRVCIFAHVNLKCICWRVFQPFLVNHQSVFLRRRCANKMIDTLRNSPKICFACLLLAKWSRRNFWFLCTRRSFITSAYHICIL